MHEATHDYADKDTGKGMLNMLAMRRILTGWLLCAVCLGAPTAALGSATHAGPVPAIKAVHFSRIGQNLHIEVDGAGFGTAPQPLPHVGNMDQFRIIDVSQGSWGAGPNGSLGLQYTSWTDTQIVVDGFDEGYGGKYSVAPGDNVTIFVQNATTSGSTTWSGTLRPEAAPALHHGGVTPQIANVHFSRIGQNLHIEVSGAGFGAAPQPLPFIGTMPHFRLLDDTHGGWGAGRSGYGYDGIGLQFTSWEDSRIVIDGFDEHYGGTNIVTPGDSMRIYISNASSGEFAFWTGVLRPGPTPAPDHGGPTPQIERVYFSKIGQSLHIEVDGAGFGAAPQAMPFVGTMSYFRILDDTHGGWGAGRGGYGYDGIGLQYTSWTDTRITISGYDAGYGGVYVVTPGDRVRIFVANVRSGEFVIWSGTLVPGAQPTPVQLISPTRNSVVSGSTVQFNWTPVSGAARYYLQVYLAQVAPGTSPAKSTVQNIALQASQTRYTLNTAHLLTGTYRWRVAAIDGHGLLIAPGWADEFVFTLS